ncbi:MAG: DMT family transporter [Pseudomonadota bacterium]
MAISENMRGALLMMGSMSAFTINDTFMKALSDEVPLYQSVFLRSVFVICVLMALAWSQGTLPLKLSRHDKVLVFWRSLSEMGAAFFFITALFNMPIANVTAIIQALPLTVTLAGAVFLREPVGWRRMIAIAVGFFGMLLIVRPGGDSFSIYSLYALAAVICVTFRDLCVRRMSRDVPSLIVALAAAISVALFMGGMSATEAWVPMGAVPVAQLFGAGLFVIGGYVFSVAAMRVGEIGFVAPFRYTSLLAALILGFLIFGEWPDSVTLIGAAIVVFTGIFTLYRESRTERGSGKALRPR